MGDRTTVCIHVMPCHAEEAEKLIDGSRDDSPISTQFTLDEVNYANVTNEVNLLTDAGIACDVYWEPGDDYDSGSAWYRFDKEGNPYHKEIFDEDTNISVRDLMDKITDLQAVAAMIRQREDYITPLPWGDEQIEYGKRYKVKRLLENK